MVIKEIKMDVEYRYTIIIPHHNIPHLLDRCLSSIPHREDLQIIVVDDCSDSDSLEKLKIIQSKYDYVTFIYLSINLGGGKARNEGLKLAKGYYILFADADDFFNYCINQILDDYKELDFDAVYFNANSVDTDTYRTSYRCKHLNKIIQNADKNKKKAIFLLKYRFGEPWCKMIKRKIIKDNNISFSETIIHNDTKYSYLVGYYSTSIKIDKRAIYCVTDRAGSVSKNKSVERLFIRTQIFAEAIVFFQSHNIIKHSYNLQMHEGFLFSPLYFFLLKADWQNSKCCINIMRKSGLTNKQIELGFLLYVLRIIKRKILHIFNKIITLTLLNSED